MTTMAIRRSYKVIISCAITGAIHTPTLSEALPYKPADIAQQAVEAAEAFGQIMTTSRARLTGRRARRI